ncbi:MAG: hypothetical protein ACRYG2_30890, partial [Janthinobacterium lividum]
EVRTSWAEAPADSPGTKKLLVQFSLSDVAERRVSTMAEQWTSPSGSRWEPATAPVAPAAPASLATPTAAQAAAAPRRRHRRPVVAVLLTLLGAGAATGGAAYVHSVDTPSGALTGRSGPQVAGSDDHGGRHHEPRGTRP